MSTPNHIDSDALRRYADRFSTDVGAKLYAANQTLAKAQEIEYSNFTSVHVPLAVVYVEAFNTQHIDLEQKAQQAEDLRTNLRNSADAWDQAELANTLHADTQNPSGPR